MRADRLFYHHVPHQTQLVARVVGKLDPHVGRKPSGKALIDIVIINHLRGRPRVPSADKHRLREFGIR